MPDEVLAELEERQLVGAYSNRPFYQRADYLAWISRAKRVEGRQRRITQMLDELDQGGAYMGMDHPSSARA